MKRTQISIAIWILCITTLHAQTTANIGLFYRNGNLGIGQVTPNYPLDVSGQVNVAPSNISGPQLGLRLNDTGSEASDGLYILWESPSRPDMARILGNGDTQGGSLSFYTNNLNSGTAQQRMVINGIGNVGIGTIPTVPLDVNGTIRIGPRSEQGVQRTSVIQAWQSIGATDGGNSVQSNHLELRAGIGTGTGQNRGYPIRHGG